MLRKIDRFLDFMDSLVKRQQEVTFSPQMTASDFNDSLDSDFR